MQTLFERLVAQLRAWGMGERVIKSAVAVMLAWELGSLLPGGSEHPYFAPLAALLSFQVTIADSLRLATQRIVGIVAGVILALAISQLLGVSVWSVGLITFLGLALGLRLHLAAQGLTQVAISGLIVLFIGGADNLSYAGYRILESIVGAVVGVCVNMFVVPPSYLDATQGALQKLADALADQLDRLAQAIGQGLPQEQAQSALETARGLQTPLSAAQAMMQRATTNLKYHPLRHAQEAQVEHFQAVMTILEHNVIQVRSISRTLYECSIGRDGFDWSEPSDLTLAYADLLGSLARQLRAIQQLEAADIAEGKAAFAAFRAAIERATTEGATRFTPLTWMHLGALLATAERLSNDLATLGAASEARAEEA